LVATADSTTNVPYARFPAFLLPPLGVRKVLVSAVEDDIVAFEIRRQALEDFVADAPMRQ
jgi:hypothetical protein